MPTRLGSGEHEKALVLPDAARKDVGLKEDRDAVVRYPREHRSCGGDEPTPPLVDVAPRELRNVRQRRDHARARRCRIVREPRERVTTDHGASGNSREGGHDKRLVFTRQRVARARIRSEHAVWATAPEPQKLPAKTLLGSRHPKT